MLREVLRKVTSIQSECHLIEPSHVLSVRVPAVFSLYPQPARNEHTLWLPERRLPSGTSFEEALCCWEER